MTESITNHKLAYKHDGFFFFNYQLFTDASLHDTRLASQMLADSIEISQCLLTKLSDVSDAAVNSVKSLPQFMAADNIINGG